MRITKIEFYQVDVPWRERIRPYMEKVYLEHEKPVRFIYKVYTDEGIVGFGENWMSRTEYPVRDLLGKDPFDLLFNDEYASLQPAIYDIIGKKVGIPACKLLGPRYRDKVPVGYWSHCLPPEILAKEVEVAVEAGFKVHKLKARPAYDVIEQVKRMSDAAPSDYQFIVDPNCLWILPQAVKIAKKLERFNIFCLESPLPQQDIEGYRELRSKTVIPLAMHIGLGSGSEWTPNPITAIERRMVDYFVVEEKGVRATLGNAFLAEIAIGKASASGGYTVGGMPLWIEVVGLGIIETFGIHLASVMKNAILPSITFVHSHFLRKDDLLETPLKMKDGYVEVPDKPGLGLELDEKALKRYTVRRKEFKL